MKTWLIALGITLFQLVLAMSFTRAPDLETAYRQLCGWDSATYCDIAERGYALYDPPPPPGNAKDNGGFFPGYPLAARVLYLVIGLDPPIAILVVAQTCAVVFWAGLLFLLKRWHIGIPYRALAILAVLAHPCSFYLVVGYSESLFCASLVLFIYFSLGRSIDTQVGTAACGFVATATRLMALPIVGLPAIGWLLRKRPSFGRAVVISTFSLFGVGLFCLYCKLHFGDFNHYLNTQREGYRVDPDRLAVFKLDNYEWTGGNDQTSFIVTPLALWLTLLIELKVWFSAVRGSPRFRKKELWRVRVPWYLAALGIWYLSSSGVAHESFQSLIRYSFPWTVLLIIAWSHLFSFSVRLPDMAKTAAFAILAIALGLLFSRSTLVLLNTWLHGGWVS